MRAFQTPALVLYFDRRRRASADTPAPDRPSEDHVWQDGTGWILPADWLARRIAIKVDNAVARLPLAFELIYLHALDPLNQPPPITRPQLRTELETIQGTL